MDRHTGNSTVEGQEVRCCFLFFESIRGRDYFLSPEKKRSFVVLLPVYLMHYHANGLRHKLAS